MVLRTRRAGEFIEPCLPTFAKAAPPGPEWIHEIKHDGFRLMARRDVAGVRLVTRKSNDFSARFPFIAMAVSNPPARSYLIDGETIVIDDAGLAAFELIRRHRTNAAAVLCAFDLLELDGDDLRRLPIESRKESNLDAVIKVALHSNGVKRHLVHVDEVLPQRLNVDLRPIGLGIRFENLHTLLNGAESVLPWHRRCS